MADNKEKKVAKQYGKVARLPKNSDAQSFMEKIKIPKNKLWYVIVEKADDELHLVKFNEKDGVKANSFVAELKKHYIETFGNANDDLKKILESIHVVGNDKFSVIKNVPKINLGDKTLISKLTEDLIKLLR